MRAARQGVAAAALVIVVAACRQVVGIGDPEPPLRCAAPAESAPECGACLERECCVEIDACGADSSCRDLLACRAACTDDACREHCERRLHATDTTAALLACEAARCELACGLACGGAGSPFAGCQPCAEPCCAGGARYRSSLEGQRLRACRFRCNKGDVACPESCVNTLPMGADLEHAANACVARACGIAGNWSCVGKVAPAAAIRTPTTLALSVVAFDLEDLAPVADVTVRGCSAGDLACTQPPYGATTTTPDGRATLAIRLTPGTGFDAYPGYLELTKEGRVTSLLFFNPPVARDVEVFVAMVRDAHLARMEEAAGAPLAADRGVLAAYAFDCRADAVAGVAVRADTADGASRPYQLKSTDAAGPVFDFATTTSSSLGIAGVYNVPAGVVNVTSTVEGLCLETSRAAVAVRPGAITHVDLRPLP